MAEVTVPKRLMDRIRKEVYVFADRVLKDAGKLDFTFEEPKYSELREHIANSFLDAIVDQYKQNPEYRKRLDELPKSD